MPWPLAISLVSLAVWLYLLAGRDGFWRARPRLEAEAFSPPAAWPAVVAVVPARNEAELVGAALASLLDQDYPGPLAVVLVDDHSTDDTRAIAEAVGAGARGRTLETVTAPPLPEGWTGKLWALAAGLRAAARLAPEARHLLLTDADVVHDPANLRRLVAQAEAGDLDLVSAMVRLRCVSFWERLLVPPFVFFFQMLYPFGAVADPRRRTAAAAGGCMLVRRGALAEAGGIGAIRDRLIDDVALARAIKHRPGGGRIWLGLAERTVSRRRHDRLGAIWAMVARTADTQLRHSPVLLLGTVLAMALTHLLPPLAALVALVTGNPLLGAAGALAWAMMAVAYLPMVRFHRLASWWTLTLPIAAALYLAMTVDSAIQHRLGRGGVWKGRVQAPSR